MDAPPAADDDDEVAVSHARVAAVVIRSRVDVRSPARAMHDRRARDRVTSRASD